VRGGVGEREKFVECKERRWGKGGSYRLRFANVDDRLTVWVDDRLPFGDGVVYDPPAQRGPTPENDLQPAGVGVRGATVTVSKLQLWRDTYYQANTIPPGP